ncbi:MAG: glycosyltransferase [Candidatus Promineifilaceae bacterium]|nr:glycosyltransferase [Candidatus Promineifilaceae bacterium]
MQIFQFNFFGKGHIYPTIPIVRALIERGVRVTSYGLPQHQGIISASGAQFRAYSRPPQREKNAMQLAAYQTSWALDLLPGLLADINDDQPQIVITDSMLPLGWYAAQIASLPLVVITTHAVANDTISRTLGLTEEQILRNGDMVTFQEDLSNYRQAAETLQEIFGLAPLPARHVFQIPADLTLVTTSSALQPAADLLDSSYKFVGPMIESRGEVADFPLQQFEGGPLVYVSLGTMAHDLDVYKIFPEAFDGAPYHVVISAGGKPFALQDLPENFSFYEFVPQLDLLTKVDVFVTHGGWNSVNEALYNNVPMVVCPQGKDQFINAQVLEQLGVGKALYEPTPARVRAAVDELLADRAYRLKAEEVGATLRKAGGSSSAADEILGLAAG